MSAPDRSTSAAPEYAAGTETSTYTSRSTAVHSVSEARCSRSHCTPLTTVSRLVRTNAAGRDCRPASTTGRCEITAGQPRAAATEDGGGATLTGPSAAGVAEVAGARGESTVWLTASASSTVTGTATAVATNAARRRTGSIGAAYRCTTGQVRVRVMPSTDCTLATTSLPSSSTLRASARTITSYGPVTSSARVTPLMFAISRATRAALPTSVWIRM